MAEDQKNLEKLLILLRRQGVTEFDGLGVKLKLGEKPVVVKRGNQEKTEEKDEWSDFPEGELTPEQLAYYSSGGSPDDDPFRKDKQ